MVTGNKNESWRARLEARRRRRWGNIGPDLHMHHQTVTTRGGPVLMLRAANTRSRAFAGALPPPAALGQPISGPTAQEPIWHQDLRRRRNAVKIVHCELCIEIHIGPEAPAWILITAPVLSCSRKRKEVKRGPFYFFKCGSTLARAPHKYNHKNPSYQSCRGRA